MRRVKNVEANIAVSDSTRLPADVMATMRSHRWIRTYSVP
jgi:hypothetical protein